MIKPGPPPPFLPGIRAQPLRRGHQIAQGLFHFRPLLGLQAAIRIDPQALRLAMDQHVQPERFLTAHGIGDLVPHQLSVQCLGQTTRAVFLAHFANRPGLREGADGGHREHRQAEPVLLQHCALGIRRLPPTVALMQLRNPFANRRIMRAAGLPALGERLLVLAEELIPRVEATERALKDTGAGRQGRLHMAVECHSCFDWLMPTMDHYRQDWPEVEYVRVGLSMRSLSSTVRKQTSHRRPGSGGSALSGRWPDWWQSPAAITTLRQIETRAGCASVQLAHRPMHGKWCAPPRGAHPTPGGRARDRKQGLGNGLKSPLVLTEKPLYLVPILTTDTTYGGLVARGTPVRIRGCRATV